MRRTRRTVLVALVGVAAVLALGACGASSGRTIVHVESDAITTTQLAAQMQAIAPERFVPDAPRFAGCVARLTAQQGGAIAEAVHEECEQRYQYLKQRALSELIADRWLIGEAEERGIELPGGSSEARAHAAAAKLTDALSAAAVKGPTPAQVAAYYEQNVEQFGRPERRNLEIVEHIPTRADAQRRLREVMRRGDMTRASVHEQYYKLSLSKWVPQKRAILKAIFAAKPGAFVGPLPLNEQWCFFRVTRVVPADLKPLALVRNPIERQLISELRHSALIASIAAWRRKWIARTRCSAGYVVQRCSEYRGLRQPEAAGSFS